jgi:hypothetical protein
MASSHQYQILMANIIIGHQEWLNLLMASNGHQEV